MWKISTFAKTLPDFYARREYGAGRGERGRNHIILAAPLFRGGETATAGPRQEFRRPLRRATGGAADHDRGVSCSRGLLRVCRRKCGWRFLCRPYLLLTSGEF